MACVGALQYACQSVYLSVRGQEEAQETAAMHRLARRRNQPARYPSDPPPLRGANGFIWSIARGPLCPSPAVNGRAHRMFISRAGVRRPPLVLRAGSGWSLAACGHESRGPLGGRLGAPLAWESLERPCHDGGWSEFTVRRRLEDRGRDMGLFKVWRVRQYRPKNRLFCWCYCCCPLSAPIQVSASHHRTFFKVSWWI